MYTVTCLATHTIARGRQTSPIKHLETAELVMLQVGCLP